MVCKYWYDICHCEYVEGREAPDTDYVPIPSLSSLPTLPPPTQLTYDLTSTHHSMPTEIVLPLKSKAEELPSPKKSEIEEPKVALKVEENISSLSDDNHIARSSALTKKQSEIEKYLEGVELKGSDEIREENASNEEIRKIFAALQQMESEKNEVKEKIFQWKRHFEKKYRRPASDEEKVRNIPGLFQRYSIVRLHPLLLD